MNINNNQIKPNNKKEIQNITLIDSIEGKLAAVKDILVNTDIVKSQNAFCQFDDEQWYREENHLKKFLGYKNRVSPIYYDTDCDVSLLCVVMYSLLSNNIELENIVYQHGSTLKYEIQNNGRRFKGDTLTSALYVLKQYLGCLWLRLDNNNQLRRMKRYTKFYELFQGVSNGIPIPAREQSNWNSYCYEYSDTIWKAMDNEAKLFFKNYTMFGNYMLIPGGSYQVGKKWTSFNVSRSNYGRWDTVDTLLLKIWAYYKYSDSRYLDSIFTDKKAELICEAKQWLDEFASWNDFVEKNALTPFIDKKRLIPISLKTGKPINVKKLNTYDAIPQNYREFLIFFRQVAERIAIRSECIYDRLSSRRSTI